MKRLLYGPNRLDIELESEAAGLLVVADSYFPGWRATVNGAEVSIGEVNGAFRAVRVPSGISRVVMTYEPASVRIGLAISLLTLGAALAVTMVVAARRALRARREPRK